MKLLPSQSAWSLPEMTHHALIRIGARRLPYCAIAAALTFGRLLYIRGAQVYVVGRREVQEAGDQVAWLAQYIGVHVVCGDGGRIITAYRSRDLRSLRPRRRGSERLWRAHRS
jgi:hypothetical protein